MSNHIASLGQPLARLIFGRLVWSVTTHMRKHPERWEIDRDDDYVLANIGGTWFKVYSSTLAWRIYVDGNDAAGGITVLGLWPSTMLVRHAHRRLKRVKSPPKPTRGQLRANAALVIEGDRP